MTRTGAHRKLTAKNGWCRTPGAGPGPAGHGVQLYIMYIIGAAPASGLSRLCSYCGTVRARAGRRGPLVPVQQDVLRVRASARVAAPVRGCARVRRPASAGHQRREEHRFGRRAGGFCLRRRCKTGRGNPGAVAGETGTPTREGSNPRPSRRGGCQRSRNARRMRRTAASSSGVTAPRRRSRR